MHISSLVSTAKARVLDQLLVTLRIQGASSDFRVCVLSLSWCVLRSLFLFLFLSFVRSFPCPSRGQCQSSAEICSLFSDLQPNRPDLHRRHRGHQRQGRDLLPDELRRVRWLGLLQQARRLRILLRVRREGLQQVLQRHRRGPLHHRQRPLYRCSTTSWCFTLIPSSGTPFRYRFRQNCAPRLTVFSTMP